MFRGELTFTNEYAISVRFHAQHDSSSWLLTNIYAPCHTEGKIAFLEWFIDFQISQDEVWLVLGDFNLIQRPKNRNKEGGIVMEMLLF